MAKFSFIVPVYNCGEFLQPCVESLLRQTGGDYEILLVDDGAGDGSGVVCDRLAETHARVRVFHKENGGAASARNLGIREARGDYLIFIDGDDTVEPELLERVEDALKEESPDLVIFGISFDYYEKAGQPERREILAVRHPGRHDRAFFRENFRGLFADNALSSACNKVFSREILRKAGLAFREDMTLYEDLEFVLRYLQAAESFVCLEKALYHYRIDAAGFSGKRTEDLMRLGYNLHALAETVFSLEPLPEAAAEVTVELYLGLLLRHLLTAGNPDGKFQQVCTFCEDPLFRRALDMSKAPAGREGTLLELVESREERKMGRWLRYLRMKSGLRRTVGKTLRKLGLRR